MVGTGRRAEEGFTLVELVVSLTVLAVGILGLVGVSNSSFKVAGTAGTRSKAVALTTQKLEELRAIPYRNLPTGATMTTETVQQGGTVYTVERAVTDEANGSVAQAYKSAVVSVSWTDASGVHETHQSSYIYPGGIGPANAASTLSVSTGPSCTPAAPTLVTALLPLDVLQQSSVVDLTWAHVSTCLASTFIIQYSTDDFATSTEVTRGATVTSYRVTGLPASSSVKFRIAARSAGGQQSGWSTNASATTTAAAPPTCKLGSVSITPAAAEKKSASGGSGLEVNPVVRLTTQGPCTGFRAVYQPTLNSVREALFSPGANGSYTATLAGTTVAWDVGKRYVDVYDSFSAAKVATVLLTVCDHNVSTCA